MEYLVIFLNYDGTELYKTMVKAGETAVYQGGIPVKPNEEFIGWNKSLKNVTDNMFVTAVFEKAKKGNLKLGALSFIENDKHIHVIEEAVITNEDLHQDKNKETDFDR